MADKSVARVGMSAAIVCALTACGQTGPLYLPDAPSHVITRPADTPPASQNTEAAPPSPASEATAPEGTPPADNSTHESKKEKGAAPPPPPPPR